MNIGLYSGTVALERIDGDAGADFADAHRQLGSVIPQSWAIAHIGSTAVTGMLAKPIIDIAIAVPREDDIPMAIQLIERVGFRYRGFREDAGGHVFDYVVTSRTTRHLHLVTADSQQFHEYLLFRDTLRDSVAIRRMYEAFKSRLACQFPNDRRSYTTAKRDFVASVIRLYL